MGNNCVSFNFWWLAIRLGCHHLVSVSHHLKLTPSLPFVECLSARTTTVLVIYCFGQRAPGGQKVPWWDGTSSVCHLFDMQFNSTSVLRGWGEGLFKGRSKWVSHHQTDSPSVQIVSLNFLLNSLFVVVDSSVLSLGITVISCRFTDRLKKKKSSNLRPEVIQNDPNKTKPPHRWLTNEIIGVAAHI